jgi:cytochrome c oxidase subunit III
MTQIKDKVSSSKPVKEGGTSVQDNLVTLSTKHPYHMVDPSPWPFVGGLSALVLAIGGVLAMHGMDKYVFPTGVAMILFTVIGWWRDVIKEGNTPGLHTEAVRRGLRVGMLLFICSEVMFFVAFFWAYFNAALDPTEAIGHVWPPKNIVPFDPFHLPYFNTLVLLLSGTTITWAHHALLDNHRKDVLVGLAVTVGLGLLFTAVQTIEYAHAAFSFKGGIYPSTFFMATGFHGFHVIVGTLFLVVCLIRAYRREFSPDHHVGFEAAAWYWHFVDVVWLFLFVSIYWWGYVAPE